METAALAQPGAKTFERVASPWHTVIVLGIVAASVYRGMTRVEQMRDAVNLNRIALYEKTILFEWLTLGLVLVGVWLNASSLTTVLGDRWRSARDLLRDAGIGFAFLIVSIVVTSILGAHQATGDRATLFLLPQNKIETALWIVLSITAGICEEAVYRGYLQKQFMALTKNAPAGIILSALTFGLAHSYQGFARALPIGVMGALAGVLAYWRRSVRPGMIAHALQDVLGAFVRH
jgi:membrane protease YdiL (CAAX protease family)